MKPSYRTWLEIDGAALRANLAALHRRRSQTAILPIVKGNAYGHGMIPIARELWATGKIVALGVADIGDLRQLRADSDCRAIPTLLCAPTLPQEMDEIVALNGELTISTFAEAAALARAARKRRRIAKTHFKVDIGMGRLGLAPDRAADKLRRILTLDGLKIATVWSHFPSADTDPELTKRQEKLFHQWRAEFPNLPWHLANSAAFLRGIGVEGSAFARIGLALYGIPPYAGSGVSLRPVMSWKTRITLLRDVPAGSRISYGGHYRLPRAQRLATLSIGYSDGYSRLLSNRASVLVDRKRCPIRGNVTMNQIVVDVSRVPAPHVGQEVVVLGQDKLGKAEITADELARFDETISYEVVTATSARLPRVLRGFKISF